MTNRLCIIAETDTLGGLDVSNALEGRRAVIEIETKKVMGVTVSVDLALKLGGGDRASVSIELRDDCFVVYLHDSKGRDAGKTSLHDNGGYFHENGN